MSDTPDIIGRGFTFPFRVDKTGSIALTTGADDIDSAMRVILCTAPGERVMRPEFGCKIWDLLFEPIDANTLGLMAEYVRLALSQWEPRAIVDDVTVTPRVCASATSLNPGSEISGVPASVTSAMASLAARSRMRGRASAALCS